MNWEDFKWVKLGEKLRLKLVGKFLSLVNKISFSIVGKQEKTSRLKIAAIKNDVWLGTRCKS